MNALDVAFFYLNLLSEFCHTTCAVHIPMLPSCSRKCFRTVKWLLDSHALRRKLHI